MDENKKTELKVGIFLALGAIAIMISLFMLGADRVVFNRYIRLHVHFDQVQGLAKGSLVSLAGVVIGNVEDITFSENGGVLDVRFRVEDTFQAKISKTSLVDIRSAGALGDKFIYISPGDLKEGFVQDGDILNLSKTGDIFSIIGQRASEAEKIFDIVNNLHLLTSELVNDQKVAKILTNFQSLSKSAEQSATEINKLLVSINSLKIDKTLKDSMEKVDRIVTKIDQGQGTLGALINDPTLHDQLSQFLGGSSRKKYLKNMMRTSIEEAEKQ